MSMYRPHDPYQPYQQPRRQPGAYAWAILIGLVILLIVVWRLWPARGPSLDPSYQQREITPAGNLSDAEKAIIQLYRNSAPSVVNVASSQLVRNRFNYNVQKLPKGSGTGFLWDAEGHVVTNYHVVQRANEVEVTLADHSTWKARRVVVDPDMDLAVLWIDAPKARLRPLPLGRSTEIQVGQYAFAIGNPFGLDQSLSPGFVSALNREIESPGGRPITGVIQTTAPINPGNSGGPLLDSFGRLIGVNTAIVSPSGAWAGIGFAIPVDDVNRVVTQLIQRGSVTRAALGIDEAPDHLARRAGARGVMIGRVVPGGPAEEVKLQGAEWDSRGVVAKDSVVALNGKPVHNCGDLRLALMGRAPGDVVTLTVLRGGQEITVRVTLADEKGRGKSGE